MPNTIPFIIGTGEVERKTMATYVNIGTTAAKIWEVVGVKIEDSAQEFNADIETITDILGITTTSVNKLEPQQSFEPFTIRRESQLAEKLFNIVIVDKNLPALQEFEVMTVYGFAGESTDKMAAEIQTGCTIEPTSIGGSGRVDLPFNIHYSQKSTWGTVSTFDPEDIEFEPAAA